MSRLSNHAVAVAGAGLYCHNHHYYLTNCSLARRGIMVAWEYCDAVVPVDFVELKILFSFLLIRIKIFTVDHFLRKKQMVLKL